MKNEIKLSPTEFITVVNQTLEYAYSGILIEGEVASFKINQGKWVFFDIKDEESSLSCFMTLYQLRMPLENGMRVVVRGVPKVTKWGKFSLTVQVVQPVGEGSLKKAYEILKKKLTDEGLFAPERKRDIPKDLTKIGVISSTAAAGYADFIKIINARWGGLKIQVAHTQVQGLDAPDQIMRALKFFNERSEVQMIAILRGGGSADDLAVFNDEALVRMVAASKIPIITGIGHEIDESLCDLAADKRASTPSNAAEILTPDRGSKMWSIKTLISDLSKTVIDRTNVFKKDSIELIAQIANITDMKMTNIRETLSNQIRMLETLNPENTLKLGYAILRGKISPGSVVKITTYDKKIKAEIKEVYGRN